LSTITPPTNTRRSDNGSRNTRAGLSTSRQLPLPGSTPKPETFAKKPAICGIFDYCKQSPCSQISQSAGKFPQVSADSLNYSRFLEFGDYFDHQWVAPSWPCSIGRCLTPRQFVYAACSGGPALCTLLSGHGNSLETFRVNCFLYDSGCPRFVDELGERILGRRRSAFRQRGRHADYRKGTGQDM
jgi:hypothetical protein